MKTSADAWRVYKLRIWAGLAILVALALLEFGLVFRFELSGDESLARSGLVSGSQGLGDWFAGR